MAGEDLETGLSLPPVLLPAIGALLLAAGICPLSLTRRLRMAFCRRGRRASQGHDGRHRSGYSRGNIPVFSLSREQENIKERRLNNGRKGGRI
jgi:hypothetical protein